MAASMKDDLARHAHDRLAIWLCDTMDTYQRADIEVGDAVSDLVYELTLLSCSLMALSTEPKDHDKLMAHVTATMSEMMKYFRKMDARGKRDCMSQAKRTERVGQ